MAAKNLPPIRRKLLHWYDKHRRDLPWRRTDDPYAIWISEIMLQQTQVATVLPYYEKFLRAFPTMESLDGAPLERVLRAWSGLGYYRRAENLKKAARQIRRAHGGALPGDYRALRQLPGIGDYTAGALMSIAFHQRYPAIDSNARRVLVRLFALDGAKPLRTIARALVSRSRPADFNQALIDLGAIRCYPKQPLCTRCPLSADCAERSSAHRKIRSRQRKSLVFKDVTWPLAIVHQRGRILLRRRGAKGLLARLWELPGGELTTKARPMAFLRGELRPLDRSFNDRILIGEIRHSITNRRIRAPIYFFDCRPDAKLRLPSPRWRWIDLKTLSNQAMSSMTAKALKVFAP